MNDDRKQILEMVESGQLSTKEALILLEALEKDDARKHTPVEADKKKSEEGKQAEGSTAKEDQNDDRFYSQLENAGERIVDFVNQAFKKIKDIDLQFTQSVEVPHVFQQAGEEVETIDIDIENGPITFIAWDQEDVRVECNAKVYRSDDRENARSYFLEHTKFLLKDGLLCYGTDSKWMRVESTIYLPHKQYKKIKVRVFHGEVAIDDLKCEQLTVKTMNGKVELSKVNGEKIEVETVNGQVGIAHSNAGKLEVETMNGTIDTAGFYRTIELKSFNGNIVCTLNENGTSRLDAKGITGNIHLLFPKTASVDGEARSNLGSYKLELDGIDVLYEKKEVIQKQVKFKRISSDDRMMHVLADTKTGSVYVRETEQKGE